MDFAGYVLPTQLAFAHPTPVTIPIFSSCDSLASAAVALACASSQDPTVRLADCSLDGIAMVYEHFVG